MKPQMLSASACEPIKCEKNNQRTGSQSKMQRHPWITELDQLRVLDHSEYSQHVVHVDYGWLKHTGQQTPQTMVRVRDINAKDSRNLYDAHMRSLTCEDQGKRTIENQGLWQAGSAGPTICNTWQTGLTMTSLRQWFADILRGKTAAVDEPLLLCSIHHGGRDR